MGSSSLEFSSPQLSWPAPSLLASLIRSSWQAFSLVYPWREFYTGGLLVRETLTASVSDDTKLT